MKRPKLITVIAIFFLISIPLHTFTVITVKESAYRENINNHETLIKDGEIKYRGSIVRWNRQSETAKQRIIHELTLQKVIVSNFLIFRIFKWLFIILTIFLVYSLWNLKKYMPIILILQTFFGILFNLIFPYFNFTFLMALLVPEFLILIAAIIASKKYFIY